jgi:hypothetical protein
MFDHTDFSKKTSVVDPDPDSNPDGSALDLVGRIRTDIKCWVLIRTETYADPQHWNRYIFKKLGRKIKFFCVILTRWLGSATGY